MTDSKAISGLVDCKHLTTSAEAYVIGTDGKSTPFTVHLCLWADAHPDRFLDAPRWISRPAIGSLAINVARDCVGCPGYEAKR